MRKIISFKRELPFKTKVCEITSISLEHIIKKQDDDLVSGEFLINGEYKMTEGSINKEKYDFKLPFDIALNSNYDSNSIKLDIDNFYYEIINNEILKVNVDLLIEAKEKEIIPEPINKNYEELLTREDLLQNEEADNQECDSNENIDEEQRKPLKEEIEIENEIEDIKDSNIIIENNTKIIENNIKQLNIKEKNDTNQNEESLEDDISNSLFNNINDNETYRAYYVYIVKEEDTIDKILERYKITKEELENYNNIENIKPFDKIIIPTNGN